MADEFNIQAEAVLVDDQVWFTLADLCQVCRVERSQLVALVDEGVLQPAGDSSQEWRFAGTTLRRARTAVSLARDLELGASATALVLDLLDQIDVLQARLHRGGLD